MTHPSGSADPQVPLSKGQDATASENPYVAVQKSAEFQELRRKFRGFVFPVAAFFLAWYFLYVLCAVLAPGFMAIKLVGNINVGLVFGLLQFVSTFAITIVYARWANKVFDPAAEKVARKLDEVAP